MTAFAVATAGGDRFVAMLVIVHDQDRSRACCRGVLGGEVLGDRDPVIIRFCSGNIILNAGGGPADDRPGVTRAPPGDRGTVSVALDIRVPGARAICDTRRSRGAQFLTRPRNRGGGIRRCLRDPGGCLIEAGQATRQ